MSKIIYNSLLLTQESKEKLKRKFPGIHPNHFGEHITLEFEPKYMPENIGDEVVVDVIGHACDDSGEAVAVSLTTIRSQNETAHITISMNDGIKPSYSNALLTKGYEPFKSFKLTTIVSSFVAGKGHITSPFS